MKKVRKQNILFIIAAVLVLSLSVGFASAYFSDHEAAKGAATINLGAKDEIVESWDEGIKHVSIKNNSDKTELVVRVAVYGPNGENAKLSVDAKGDWEDHGDGYYYYKKILQPGKATPADHLTAKVVFKEGTEADLGDNYDIVVMQDFAQPTYKYVNGQNQVEIPAGWGYIPTIVANEEGGE